MSTLNKGKFVIGGTSNVSYGNQSPAVDAVPLAWLAGDFRQYIGANVTILGWRCTVGGTPGTWVEIDAASNLSLVARGLQAETASPNSSIGGLAIIDGTAYYIGVPLLAGTTITGAAIVVTTVGAVLTLSKVGLYDSAMNRIAISADQGTAWQSTGVQAVSFISSALISASGLYYAAVIAKGGATPALFRTGQSMNLVGAVNAGQAPFGRQTGQTDLPNPGVLSVGGATDPIPWIGLF